MGGKWSEEARQKLKEKRANKPVVIKPYSGPKPEEVKKTEGVEPRKKHERIPECWHICNGCNGEQSGHFIDPQGILGPKACTSPKVVEFCRVCGEN